LIEQIPPIKPRPFLTTSHLDPIFINLNKIFRDNRLDFVLIGFLSAGANFYAGELFWGRKPRRHKRLKIATFLTPKWYTISRKVVSGGSYMETIFPLTSSYEQELGPG